MKQYINDFIDDHIDLEINEIEQKITEYETEIENIVGEENKEWYQRQIKIKEEQLGFLKELKNDLIKKYFGE